MPALGTWDQGDEATVIKWLKQPGDTFARGEPLVEIETDKATMVYEAEFEGVLDEIVVDAQWVAVDAPGYTPSDSWFHLAPGATRTIRLEGGDPNGVEPDAVPQVNVRALNSLVSRDASVTYR